jgi:hypothetical protein
VEEKEEVPVEEWKTCVFAITLGMPVALLLLVNMCWRAITAALALVLLDFKNVRSCLENITNQLLLLQVYICLSAVELNLRLATHVQFFLLFTSYYRKKKVRMYTTSD